MIDWIELSRLAPSIAVVLVYAFFTERMRKDHLAAVDKMIEKWQFFIESTLSEERQLRRENAKETTAEHNSIVVAITQLSTLLMEHDKRLATAIDAMKQVVQFLHGAEPKK